MQKLVVVAIGGNSLIMDPSRQRVEDQYEAVCETARHIAGLVAQGYDVIVTHGNGPQVGFIMQRAEIAREVAKMHSVPLVNCGADTQGAIGYQIQQALDNEFKRRNIAKTAVTVVTQVVVDESDLAFKHPSKPIGSFYTLEQSAFIQQEHPEWAMAYHSGQGYRRVVASPQPKEIIEKQVIFEMMRSGYCVIGVGGGGIPVVRNADGDLRGIDAVIDKDFASSLLASELAADILIISTGVEKVYLNFGQPSAQALDVVDLQQMKQYATENHFAPGSMLPKIQSVIRFLEQGGKKAIITNPQSLERAIAGETGTHIVKV